MAIAKKRKAKRNSRRAAPPISRRRAANVIGNSKVELMSAAETDHTETIGARIAQKRHALKLSQQQLATRSGVGRSLIASYEVGAVTEYNVDKIARLAAALGVTVEFLLEGAEPRAVAAHAEKSHGPITPAKTREMLRAAAKLIRQCQRQLEDILDVLDAVP